MIELSREEHRKLVDLISGMPEMATPQARIQMLDLSGLARLTPQIDVNGSALIVSSTIVSHLARFGRISWDHEALGLFLNTIMDFLGVDQQEYVSEILLRHRMMTPVAPSTIAAKRIDEHPPGDLMEKIIGRNTLRPIAFLDKARTAATSVAFIHVRHGRKQWTGTGFLITEDLLLTNHHILPEADHAEGAVYRMNYQDHPDGTPDSPQDYRTADRVLHVANEELDYAIVELAESPGKVWGFLRPASTTPALGDRVNIIQHPGGQPKQIALQDNFVEYTDRNIIQYVTATLPGSSGSPVLDDDWEVCALHHGGGKILEPASGRYFFRNEGTLLKRIMLDLPKHIRERIADAHPAP